MQGGGSDMYGGELAGPRNNAPRGTGSRLLEDFTMKRGMVFGSIIVAAMLAFELFNYSTTDFALATLLAVVPVFVAVMVWLIRILMIGTLSMAGERLFSFGQLDEAAPAPAPIEAEPELQFQPAPAAPGLHLPTAVWRGSASPVRPEP